MGRTNLDAFIRRGGNISFTVKLRDYTTPATKQDVIMITPEIGQWVDDARSRNFGATSQAILGTASLAR